TVPAVAVEIPQVVSAVKPRVEQRRHHHEHLGAKPASPHTDAEFPHRQLLGQPRIGGLIHPRGLDRLAPLHAMILPSQALATAKVCDAAMVLAPHIVEPLPTQPRDGPVRTVITIGQHDIAMLSVALLLSKQRHFPCRFALVTPYPERREGATDQVKDRDNARNRKA